MPHLDALHLQVAVVWCPVLLLVLHRVLPLLLVVALVDAPPVLLRLLQDLALQVLDRRVHAEEEVTEEEDAIDEAAAAGRLKDV